MMLEGGLVLDHRFENGQQGRQRPSKAVLGHLVSIAYAGLVGGKPSWQVLVHMTDGQLRTFDHYDVVVEAPMSEPGGG